MELIDKRKAKQALVDLPPELGVENAVDNVEK